MSTSEKPLGRIFRRLIRKREKEVTELTSEMIRENPDRFHPNVAPLAIAAYNISDFLSSIYNGGEYLMTLPSAGRYCIEPIEIKDAIRGSVYNVAGSTLHFRYCENDPTLSIDGPIYDQTHPIECFVSYTLKSPAHYKHPPYPPYPFPYFELKFQNLGLLAGQYFGEARKCYYCTEGANATFQWHVYRHFDEVPSILKSDSKGFELSPQEYGEIDRAVFSPVDDFVKRLDPQFLREHLAAALPNHSFIRS